ncbi:MAG: S46 family peptidase [Acidobacteriaceae bacterium]|nr:S46 family peptidase [Acidobacteriaceae bacterium]MBV9780744.1 S46 family peptidase [Acidobacteriaceae bacterium]
MRSLLHLSRLAAFAVAFPMLFADEGMWTFDNLPAKQLKEKYDFVASKDWLRHLQLSSVRLSDGGSGSFVSAEGLLLTNHHVARGQLQKSSSAQHDYIKDGFYAETREQEIKCPDIEAEVLVSIENVTGRIAHQTESITDEKQQFKARKSAIAEIERDSQQKTGLQSQVVTLYSGGEYWLYRYKRYTDLRIVFAPEQQAAFYGGDPDNFTYPRYDMDLALFRVYENGKPVHSENYLKWNPNGAGDGELVFVSGNPGTTRRLATVSQLHFERDVADPLILDLIKDRIDTLEQYSNRGSEQARQAASEVFNLQNSQKAIKGERDALLNPQTFAKKEKEEQDFRALVMANSDWKQRFGGAWEAIEEATRKYEPRIKQTLFRGLDSTLAEQAETIVDYVAEIKKPDGERLPGYQEAQLNSLRFQLFSPAPIYPEFEKAKLAASLRTGLQELGNNDPFLKIVLNGKSPDDAAAALVDGTKLADPEVRKKLIEGGEAAVTLSTDPMIVLARKLDPMRRELIKWREDNVTSVLQHAGEQLGKARFLAYGKSTYPDATFTLRLSYGQVKGYPMNGTLAPSKTTFYGLYDRAASFNDRGPFVLPARYEQGRNKLTLSTPFDFVTTNDIVGGNSGSPVVNRQGELVGLIFDGNIESLAGDYVYDETVNRSVAVHTAAMTEVLRKLYNVGPLLNELGIREDSSTNSSSSRLEGGSRLYPLRTKPK